MSIASAPAIVHPTPTPSEARHIEFARRLMSVGHVNEGEPCGPVICVRCRRTFSLTAWQVVRASHGQLVVHEMPCGMPQRVAFPFGGAA